MAGGGGRASCLILFALLSSCEPYEVYDTDLIPDLGLRSTEEVMEWVSENIAYVWDDDVHGDDEWQLPHQTYLWRTGDCEDFAVLASYLLWRIGKTPYVELGTSDDRSRHAWNSVDGEHWEPQLGRRHPDLPKWYHKWRETLPYEEAMSQAESRSVAPVVTRALFVNND